MSQFKNQSFLSRLRFAIAGLIAGLKEERSLRFQLIALLGVIVLLIVVKPEPVWWALVTLASGAVISAELFNTAVEHLADLLHPQVHPKIRIVKDCAAAAVLIASLCALGVAAALAVHLLSGRV